MWFSTCVCLFELVAWLLFVVCCLLLICVLLVIGFVFACFWLLLLGFVLLFSVWLYVCV